MCRVSLVSGREEATMKNLFLPPPLSLTIAFVKFFQWIKVSFLPFSPQFSFHLK